jgi:uncharacterized membrane protein YesL
MREKNAQLSAFFDRIKAALSRATDLFLLNWLLILCCIPVITAGAAETACQSCLIRMLQGEPGLPIAPFFRTFKKSFKKTTPAWLIQLLIMVVLAGDAYYAVALSDPINVFFLTFAIVMGLALFSVSTWFYCLFARFDNNLKGHIKNAGLMAFAHLPKTILVLIIHALVIAIPLFLPSIFTYLGWLWIMFGFSLPRYWAMKLFRNALRIPPPPKPGDELGQDFTSQGTGEED